jgi:hypothetical protein
MATKIPSAVAFAAVLVLARGACAHPPAPLVPAALVEDVKSATADVEFMDYIGTGQVIKLEPRDILVLSYLRSCEYETITGGTVVVGAERSDVQNGKVSRAKVPCDGGKIELTAQEASKSAATAFRLQSASHQPTLYARMPVIQIPKLKASEDRVLVIARHDRAAERIEIKIDETLAAGGFYDLAERNQSLTRGATYDASVGEHKVTFKIDGAAKAGKTPVVSRLLRFQ